MVPCWGTASVLTVNESTRTSVERRIIRIRRHQGKGAPGPAQHRLPEPLRLGREGVGGLRRQDVPCPLLDLRRYLAPAPAPLTREDAQRRHPALPPRRPP